MEEETLLPVPPELQAEFDEWEAISDETMRKFEEWEYEDRANSSTVPSLENPCLEKHR